MLHEIRHRLTVLMVSFLFTPVAWADLDMGKIPPRVELKAELGGRLDGSPWSSEELRGQVHVLFYVDPDVRDLNNEASEALKKERFPRDKFQSWAIINMAATWLPNFAISSSLEEKQRQYPTTIYVRDSKKVLVNKWGISDDNNDVLAFNKQGQLIFRKDGKLNPEEIRVLIQLIRDHLDR